MTILIKSILVFLLFQLGFGEEETAETTETTLNSAEAWGYGFLTGFALSLIGFVAAIMIVFLKKCISDSKFKVFVNMLYSLGCGAIVGDAIIHILPQAYSAESTNNHYVSLIFICAIAFFIIIERIFESCGITHEHWGDQQDHHNHVTPDIEPTSSKVVDQNKLKNSTAEFTKKKLISDQSIQPRQTNEPDKEEDKKSCLQNLKGKGSAGYLNLLSSFVHNFFDGFAIGVGFASQDKTIYIPVIVAVFAHQIPRQMGDVGILLKNKFSTLQTILCNGFINFMSLFGVLAGLGLGGIDDAAQNYVMVFVAGNFIYIGSDIWKHLLRNKNLLMNIIEGIAFSVGVGAMYLVLLAES